MHVGDREPMRFSGVLLVDSHGESISTHHKRHHLRQIRVRTVDEKGDVCRLCGDQKGTVNVKLIEFYKRGTLPAAVSIRFVRNNKRRSASRRSTCNN